MKRLRRWKWILGIILFVALGVGAYLGLEYWGDRGNAQTAIGTTESTVRVVRGDVMQSLTVYGEVVPKEEYTFTFAGDRVDEILVSVGQRVEQNKVLVELDDTQLELAMLQAERALQEARAEGIPAVIREKELSYQIALANYEDATLRAPFAGVVTGINQATTSSENWSLILIDTSELYIEANVNQLDAPDVAVGQTAQAVIEPLPDRTWPVEIVEVGGMAVSRGNSTVVVVTGKLPQADPSILVGYTAEMEISTASAFDVLRVPITCLLESPRGWMVMKVADEQTRPQPVTIGVRSDTYAEITSGLAEGDVILLNSESVSPARSERSEDGGPRFFQGGGHPPGMP